MLFSSLLKELPKELFEKLIPAVPGCDFHYASMTCSVLENLSPALRSLTSFEISAGEILQNVISESSLRTSQRALSLRESSLRCERALFDGRPGTAGMRE